MRMTGDIKSRRLTIISLGLIIAVAFCIRVIPQLGNVFTGETGVWYIGVDAWYHMRLADNLLVHFPDPLLYDRYALYPGGAPVNYMPMLSWLIVGISNILSLGAPSQQLMEAVGAYLPAVIGSLTAIPIYFLGKQVFRSRFVGLAGALFVMTLPTEFLFRTLLGFTDHHVLEVLFTVLVLLFLARGTVRGAILAGVCQGLLLLSWQAGVMLVGVVWVWLLGQYVYNTVRGQPVNQHLLSVGVYVWVALIVSAPLAAVWARAGEMFLVLWVVMLTAVFLWMVSRVSWLVMRAFVMAFAGSTAFVVASIVSMGGQTILTKVYVELHNIFWGFGTTIVETQPTSIITALFCYSLAGVLALGGLYVAIWKRLNPLFLLWALVMFVAAVGQRRWGYYAVIPVGLLAAYFIQYAVERFQVKRQAVAMVVICLLVAVVPIRGIMISLRAVGPDLSSDMYRSCVWMRENTPEPFNNIGSSNPDGYLSYMPTPYRQPDVEIEPSYGVLTWWDYGHWIIRIARRVPCSSPTQQYVGTQWFWRAQTEGEAETFIEGQNIRYVIVTEEMVTGKFRAIVHGIPPGGASIDLVKNWPALLPNSMASRLYYSADGFGRYKLIHSEPTVKIFERGG